MSVSLIPNQTLTFQRPLTRMVVDTLTIQNDNNAPIAFKIKTTAPRRYIVKPNAGILNEKSTFRVQFILLPFAQEPNENLQSKDKFLLETALLTYRNNLAAPIDELWAEIDADPYSYIETHRLQCTYVPRKHVPLVKQEMDRTYNELVSLEKKINAYEMELEMMRILAEKKKRTTVSLWVVMAVAVAAFLSSYILFTFVYDIK